MLRMWTNLMPRRRTDRGTWTAMLMGAGIGIAVWEWMKKSGEKNVDRDARELDRLADQVLKAASEDSRVQTGSHENGFTR
ncbi:MAG: hypothetical protein IRY98_11375 [Alicyclobacillaceae bacterium]|nr:hypothetical protein [Alicyclobacillaceae bacterium]